ncbi:MAG: 50S ribosomal protein L6 [Kiritimatiellae bacterium]|nr:50S ribosomal protein L6 [Kiritimatiellia bacterium]
MSRVGNKPVTIPAGVTVGVADGTVSVKGPAGELKWKLASGVRASVKDATVVVARDGDDQHTRAVHGTTRNLIANMIAGVQKGFSKDLEIQGVGFRAQVQGQKLVMSLGFSHPIEFVAPQGIKLQLGENNILNVSGPDKQMVGQVSAQIRSYFPAEPYKGKGVRYKGEHVRRKAGKTVA